MSKPAIDAMTLPARTSSGYPEPYRSRVLPREKRALGDAFALSTFGVNLTILPPGKESSMRHWHTHEEELVYVLEGELVLVTNAGEQVVSAGMVVGFPAGNADGHQLVNRGDRPAKYLEVSNRHDDDVATYADVDLAIELTDGGSIYTRKDGSRF